MEKIIPKKAFLGQRNLETYRVEAQVEEIQDWAFAHCKKLHTLWLPKTLQKVGKEILNGCINLQFIYVYDEEMVYETEASLLSFAVSHFQDEAVFDFQHYGEKDWYVWFDQSLINYIEAADDKDFQPFLAGGEEDYEDPGNNVESYCATIRQEKVEGILLRLYAAKYLSRDNIETYLQYLCNQENALSEVLKIFRENAVKYIKVLGEHNFFAIDNIDSYMMKLEGEIYTESRAYLLKVKESLANQSKVDVWKSFEL